MRRNRGNKDANGDIGFSLGNPLQGLSDVIFGACGCNFGCDCGRDGRDGLPGCCCIGGGSGHLVNESEIVLWAPLKTYFLVYLFIILVAFL